MKKTLLLLISVSLIICAYGQNQNKEEEEAILKVLKEETDAFIANDMNRLSAIHIQDATLTRIGQGPKNLAIYKGWDEVKKFI